VSEPAQLDQAHDGLVEFLAKCDPASPAPEGIYVERPVPFAPWIGPLVQRVLAAKILVLGQSGVGKTTELVRLERVLQNVTLVRPPVERVLDLNVIGWHDMIVFSALWYGAELAARQRGSGLPVAVHPEMGKSLFWIEQDLRKGLSRENMPHATGVQLFRNSPSDVHNRIESGRAQFWDRAVQVLNATGTPHRPVVLIWDGLEKLPPSSTTRLFQEERRYLVDLPFRTIVTAPLGLSFSPLFGEVEADFAGVHRLRALSHRPGEPGFQFLKDLALRRGAAAVFRDDLLDQTISWSGGLPRQLLQILTAGATQALTDGLSRIEAESFQRGRRKISERWQYQLEPRDYDALNKDDSKRSAEQRSRLLSLGALLEYDQVDGGLGLGINPLVGALLSQKQSAAGVSR